MFDELVGENRSEVKLRCLETLRQVAALLDAKAPGDATAFKVWLRQISQHVAEASKEVSKAEKETLDEISTALGLMRSRPSTPWSITLSTRPSPVPPTTALLTSVTEPP